MCFSGAQFVRTGNRCLVLGPPSQHQHLFFVIRITCTCWCIEIGWPRSKQVMTTNDWHPALHSRPITTANSTWLRKSEWCMQSGCQKKLGHLFLHRPGPSNAKIRTESSFSSTFHGGGGCTCTFQRSVNLDHKNIACSTLRRP